MSTQCTLCVCARNGYVASADFVRCCVFSFLFFFRFVFALLLTLVCSLSCFYISSEFVLPIFVVFFRCELVGDVHFTGMKQRLMKKIRKKWANMWEITRSSQWVEAKLLYLLFIHILWFVVTAFEYYSSCKHKNRCIQQEYGTELLRENNKKKKLCTATESIFRKFLHPRTHKTVCRAKRFYRDPQS